MLNLETEASSKSSLHKFVLVFFLSWIYSLNVDREYDNVKLFKISNCFCVRVIVSGAKTFLNLSLFELFPSCFINFPENKTQFFQKVTQLKTTLPQNGCSRWHVQLKDACPTGATGSYSPLKSKTWKSVTNPALTCCLEHNAPPAPKLTAFNQPGVSLHSPLFLKMKTKHSYKT